MLFLLFFSLKSPPSQILAFSLNLKSCADKTYRFNKTFLLVLPSHLGYLSGRRTSSISKHTGDVSVPISNSSLGPQVISSFLISQPRSMCPENDCRIKTRKFKFVKFFFFSFLFPQRNQLWSSPSMVLQGRSYIFISEFRSITQSLHGFLRLTVSFTVVWMFFIQCPM